jgi:hypothetical protein
MATKRKLESKLFKEKVRIIEYTINNPNKKQLEIASEFGIKPSTLNSWLKNKETILAKTQLESSETKLDKSRDRAVTYPDVDKAMLLWFKEMNGNPTVTLDGSTLREKANFFSVEFGHSGEISASWIERFKQRHGISRVSKHGESRVRT